MAIFAVSIPSFTEWKILNGSKIASAGCSTDFKGSSKAGRLLPKNLAITPGTIPATVPVAAEPSPKALFIPVDTVSCTAFVAADVAAAWTTVLDAVLVAISASKSGETFKPKAVHINEVSANFMHNPSIKLVPKLLAIIPPVVLKFSCSLLVAGNPTNGMLLSNVKCFVS